MSLDTTTSDPVDEAAVATTDSTETTTEAVEENEDTSQTSETVENEPGEETEEVSPDNSDETELKDWAAKKNLPLDDPLKIAKMYRESEKQLGKKGQKEGQLKAAVTSANSEAGVEDVQALRNEVTALSFYVNNPEAKQYESEMVTILEDKPWLANDLDIILAAAKGNSVTDATKLVAERQAGKKEALASAESAGRAAPPKTSATQSGYDSNQKITIDNVDELIARNGQEWFKKNYDKINAVLKG